MVPLMTLLKSHDAKASHKKSHVAHYFDHLDTTNLMAQFIMPAASCEMAPMASHSERRYVAPHFEHHDVKNSVVPFMMPLTSHDANANSITYPKVTLHLISIILASGMQWGH